MPLQTLQLAHRTTLKPTERLPFGVRCAGRYLVTPPFTCAIREKPIMQLFWGLRGSGAIILQNHRYIMKPGQVAVYLPGMRHEWNAVRGAWEFYWFSLDGALAEPITAAFGLYAEPRKAGPAPHELFNQLIHCLQRPTRDSESLASALAFQILAQAAHRPSEPANPLIAGAVELIHRQWKDPAFNVKTLAADIRINRSSLSRRFHATMGVSPTDYIQRLRLQHALALLRNTRRPAAEIARQCGFTDAAYFSRWVNRATGHTPIAWRHAET